MCMTNQTWDAASLSGSVYLMLTLVCSAVWICVSNADILVCSAVWIYTTLIFPAVNCTWQWHFDCHRQTVENAIYKLGRCSSHWHWHSTMDVVKAGPVAACQKHPLNSLRLPACEPAPPALLAAGPGWGQPVERIAANVAGMIAHHVSAIWAIDNTGSRFVPNRLVSPLLTKLILVFNADELAT